MTTSALIEENALSRDRVRHRIRRITILPEVGRAARDDVGTRARFLPKAPTRQRSELIVGNVVRHDDEQVPIASRLLFTPGAAPEQPDLLGPPHRDDLVEENPDRRDVDLAVA